MTNSMLKSTTAMVLAIGLALPQPIPAQEREPSSSETGNGGTQKEANETQNTVEKPLDGGKKGKNAEDEGGQAKGKIQGQQNANKREGQGQNRRKAKDQGNKSKDQQAKQDETEQLREQLGEATDQKRSQTKGNGAKGKGRKQRDAGDQGEQETGQQAEQNETEQLREQLGEATEQKRSRTKENVAKGEGRKQRDAGDQGERETGQQAEQDETEQLRKQLEETTGQGQRQTEERGDQDGQGTGQQAEQDETEQLREQLGEATEQKRSRTKENVAKGEGRKQRDAGDQDEQATGQQAEQDETEQLRKQLERSEGEEPQSAQDQGDEAEGDKAAGEDRQRFEAPEVEEEQKETARRKARRDDVEELSAEEQAERATRTDEEVSGAGAFTGEEEPVDRSRTTITEQQARSSNEAFRTDASGRQRRARVAKDDDDDDFLKTLGAIAAVGLGAYAVGQMLDDGGQVVAHTGDRVVVERDGHYRVIKDDNVLLHRPGHEVWTETFADGSTRTVVTAPDGVQTITVRSHYGRVLHRMLRYPNGEEVVLIDETRQYHEVDVATLSHRHAPAYDYSGTQPDDLRAALYASQAQVPDRPFSLYQIRNIDVVRYQVPVISLDAIIFETDSAVIRPSEAEALAALGNAMREAIEQDPGQVFLIEGHTDTVGSAAYNLALSDRRAESVALALTEYFDVPPANMVVQGYGESDLKIRRSGPVHENRRAAVRNITPLLNGGRSG